MATATASAFTPPANVPWQTISTAHFVFYFCPATEGSARRLAGNAEAIHDRLASELGIQPRGKTHVVVMDATDEMNGMASPAPRPHIVLYESSDMPGQGFAVGEPILGTFYHEYAHILQITYVKGFPEVITRIIGYNLFLPNASLPSWSVEGLAVYEESLFGSAGRLHNSTWRMYLRADYLDDAMASWDQVWAGPYRWPYGNTFYLYGSFFTGYLARRFGHEALARLYRDTADNIPFTGFERSFRRVFGAGYRQVVRDWYNEVERELAAESDAIRQRGLAEGRPVSRSGCRTGYGAFGPEGILYYGRRNYPSPPALMASNPGYHEARNLGFFPGSRPAVSPGGKTLAFGLLGALGDRTYSDIYLRDLTNGRTRRLTRGFRGSDPSWSPDGQALVVTRNDPPNYSLYRVSLDGATTPILQCTGLDQAFTPAWSPSGDRIAFAYYTPSAGLCIALIGPNGGTPVLLDTGASGGEEMDPAWSPDGRYLFFAADYTGIFNIYAYDFRESRLYQVTNVLTGAYAPAVSPDCGTLAYTGYHSGGFYQYVMPLHPEQWRSPDFSRSTAAWFTGSIPGEPKPPLGPEAPPDSQPATPYSALPTLNPLFNGVGGYFLPDGAFRLEVSYWGNDVLDMVDYLVSGLWTDAGPGYAASMRIRTGSANVCFESALDYPADPDGTPTSQQLRNAAGIGQSGGGLLSPLDDWSWLMMTGQTIEWEIGTGELHGSQIDGTLSLHYGQARSYPGPVDVRRGWAAGYDLAWGWNPGIAFGLQQSVDVSIYRPLFERGQMEIAARAGHATDATATFLFDVPGVDEESGNLLFEGAATIILPLFHPERGFVAFPLFLHGFNAYSSLYAGQIVTPDAAWQGAVELGLITRLQFLSLPIDIRTGYARALSPSPNPWGFTFGLMSPLF